MAEQRTVVERTRPRALRELVYRIDEATPAGRDRAVDALRALAILGVVLGHWLVSAIVDAGGGRLLGASPLQHMPGFIPVSWLLQTLAVFFLVGGYVGAQSLASVKARETGYPVWPARRLARLFRPVAALLALWAVAAGCLLATGTAYETVRTMLKLVISPLWFLLVFAVLIAATPLVARLHPVWPLAAVAVVDVLRFCGSGGLGAPAELGLINVAAGWLVPHCLGAAWARGRLAERRTGVALLAGGALATTILILWCGYPASMVGVPGAEVSNLDPPTLAAVSFGLAQCGPALLLREPLRRAMRNPWTWAAVAAVNLSAMTVFLWHQTAMLTVTATGLPFGPLPGLHTAPDGLRWVVARTGRLAAFALALAVCLAAFARLERAPYKGTRGSRVVRESHPGPVPERDRARRPASADDRAAARLSSGADDPASARRRPGTGR